MANYPYTSRMSTRGATHKTYEDNGYVTCCGCNMAIYNDQCDCCTLCDKAPQDPEACDQILRMNIYRTSREYGGPEEGGWYRTIYFPLASIVIDKPGDGAQVEETLREQYKERFGDVAFKQECNIARFHVYPVHYE